MNYKIVAGSLALSFSTLALAQEPPQNQIELKEVTISVSRMQLPLKDIPQKIELIRSSLLQQNTSENLGEILKRNTNIDIIEYPGTMTAIGMRGFPATAHNRGYTLILIDGKPSGTNNLATIPTEFIDRIEVVKGPYAVLYGTDAMGGVINIITQSPSEQPTAKVGMGVGNFGRTNYYGYASGAISSKLLFSLGYSRNEQKSDYKIGSSNLLKLTETEKLILDKKSYGDMMTNSKFQINQLNGKLDYKINNKWSANLYSNTVLSNDIESPGNYWHSYGLTKKDITRLSNYGEVRYSESQYALSISPYFSMQNESNYENTTDTTFINSKEKIKQYGVKIGNTRSWGDLKGLLGVDYDVYQVNSEYFSGKLTPATPFRPDNIRQSLSAFAQATYNWKNLFVNGGFRFSYISYALKANSMLQTEGKSEQYTHCTPSIGIKYRFTPQIHLHASAGNAYFVPDAYKSAGMYVLGNKIYVGNKDLKPETSTSFDIGVGYEWNEILHLDATFFQTYYKGKIVDDRSKIDTISYKNASKGNMSGLELLVSANISSLWNAAYKLEIYGGFTGFFTNTFDDNLKNATGEDSLVTRNMLYTRKMTGNMGIAFQNKQGFECRLNGRYSGNRLENDWMVWDGVRPDITNEDYYIGGSYTETDQILRHPAYLILDFSVHYTVNKKMKIGVSINNLYDENYTEKDGYNMPGRSIIGHFSYQL